MSTEISGDKRDLSLGEQIAVSDHEKVKTAADKKAAIIERAVNLVDAVIESPHQEEILDLLSRDARTTIGEEALFETRSELAGIVNYELAIGQLGLNAANSIRENGLPG